MSISVCLIESLYLNSIRKLNANAVKLRPSRVKNWHCAKFANRSLAGRIASLNRCKLAVFVLQASPFAKRREGGSNTRANFYIFISLFKVFRPRKTAISKSFCFSRETLALPVNSAGWGEGDRREGARLQEKLRSRRKQDDERGKGNAIYGSRVKLLRYSKFRSSSFNLSPSSCFSPPHFSSSINSCLYATQRFSAIKKNRTSFDFVIDLEKEGQRYR